MAMTKLRNQSSGVLMDALSNSGNIPAEKVVSVKNVMNMYFGFLEAFIESSVQNASSKGSNAATFKRNVANACLAVLAQDPATFTDYNMKLESPKEIMDACVLFIGKYNWIDGQISAFQEEQSHRYASLEGSACPFCLAGTCTAAFASPKFVHTNPDSIRSADARKAAKASRRLTIAAAPSAVSPVAAAAPPPQRTIPAAPLRTPGPNAVAIVRPSAQ